MVSDCNHNSFNLGIGSTRLPYSIKNSTKRSNQAPHIQKPKQHLKPHPPKTTANNPTVALSTAKQHPKHQAPPHSNQNNIQSSTKTAPKHAPVAPNTSKTSPKTTASHRFNCGKHLATKTAPTQHTNQNSQPWHQAYLMGSMNRYRFLWTNIIGGNKCTLQSCNHLSNIGMVSGVLCLQVRFIYCLL